jgi:hypothetical protein
MELKRKMLDISVKNEKLYDALLSLTKVILNIVTRKIQGDLEVMTESVWVKQSEDSYIKQQTRRILWAKEFNNTNDEIKKTQEYSDFINVVGTDEVISPQLNTLVGTCLGGFRLEATNIAFWPVYEFLTDQEIIEFNITKFNSVYSKIESDLYADEIEYENITPLCGFTMEDSEISLAENISIVKLSEKEILEFFRLGIKLGTSMGDLDFVHGIHNHAIKISYKLPKVIGKLDISIKEIEQNEYLSNKNEQSIIEALRIYKEGKLYPISTAKRGRSFLTLGISHSFENPVKRFMKNKYMLLKSEIDEFKSFWREKTKTTLQEKNFLSVGIRRFSQSNERDNVEDRIIDLMIAAEAIFLSSGGSFQGELKYRLSHRASMFIETDVDLQRYVFDFMQRAYDVRSSIVHGSKPKLPNKINGTAYTLDEFCGDIEKYLRISIKKAIDIAATNKEKSNEIDWKKVIFPSVSK